MERERNRVGGGERTRKEREGGRNEKGCEKRRKRMESQRKGGKNG